MMFEIPLLSAQVFARPLFRRQARHVVGGH